MHDYDNYRYIGTQETIQLTRKENELLKILIENKGHFVNKTTLLIQLYNENVSDYTLRCLISRLKEKIKNEITIKTKYGFGYKI